METQTGPIISAANEPTSMLSDELEFSRAESYETASEGLENVVTGDAEVVTTHTEIGESEDQDFSSQRFDVHKVNDAIGLIRQARNEPIEESIEVESNRSTEDDTTEPSTDSEMDADGYEVEQEKDEECDAEKGDETTFTIWTPPSIVDDGNVPKLSLEQLIIMALVASPTRNKSMEEIGRWINDGFQYYKDQKFQPATSNWRVELNDILHRYDFPTEPGENFLFYLPRGREWHILPKPEKAKEKHFPFFDLPFDIRLMILELLLHRPLPEKHGWIIDPDYTAKRKEKYRQPNRIPQCLISQGPHGWELRTDRLDKVLAILSVSKAAYQEAAPVFYRTNYFEFDSAVTLSRFLDGVPNRRKWIRNLVLHYDPAIHGHACSRAFNLLKRTKLRNLHIFLDEEKLIKRHSLTRISDPIVRLPGMKELGEVRGLSHVAMHGPCTRTTKYLAKLTEYKRNDSKDEDELVGLQRRKEGEKYLARLKRLWRDGKNVREQQAAKARRERLAREKAEARMRKEEWRSAKSEEKAVEKMAKGEGASTLLKREKINNVKIKKTAPILQRKTNRNETHVDEDPSLSSGEEDDNEEESFHPSDSEPFPPPLPPTPPSKRRKTIPAPKPIVDFTPKASPRIPSKRAPSKPKNPAKQKPPCRTKRISEMANIFRLTPEAYEGGERVWIGGRSTLGWAIGQGGV